MTFIEFLTKFLAFLHNHPDRVLIVTQNLFMDASAIPLSILFSKGMKAVYKSYLLVTSLLHTQAH